MRITCEVRASLAGISALPKAHLAHVLLPRRKDMKKLNNNCLAHMSENGVEKKQNTRRLTYSLFKEK